MKTEPNEPITPCLMQRVADGPDGIRANKPGDDRLWNIPCAGLTKREHFAAMAMQGEMAHGSSDFNTDHVKRIAEVSVAAADALIEALNKEV